MSIIQAKRFTPAEYHRLIELNFFQEDDHKDTHLFLRLMARNLKALVSLLMLL
ncbi:hypothetical protein WKK05_01370 [Nostoc sp. UHCC 0302]|uniref:hypothetical protein n=1 Tax=Nostoc sp. UHCC 0302 TaxID=3134896 RepID=UPI00311CB476